MPVCDKAFCPGCDFNFFLKIIQKIDILCTNKNTIDAIWGYVYVDYAAA